MTLPDFDEPFDPDLSSIECWARVPGPIRKSVEEHVAAYLPPEVLEKICDLHARGKPIGSDPAFFDFGVGMAVRNLCRARLGDHELAAHCGLGGD